MNCRVAHIFRLALCVISIGLITNGFAYSQPAPSITIIDYLTGRLSTERKLVTIDGKTSEARIGLENLCPVYSPNAALQRVAGSVFAEYGAMFVGDNNIFVNFPLVPKSGRINLVPQCVFFDEAGVQAYQSYVKVRRENIGGTMIELEEDAMAALIEARKHAAARNIRITPRGGSTAARRSYADTKRLWDSRFYPGLAYWTGKKMIPPKLAQQIRAMNIVEQVAAVLELEEGQHAFFSKDLSKSILYSVAPPGTSQHLFMIAVDIEQYARKDVRDILASHGWFQTVKSDLPHFTYLGVMDESQLKARGLKKEKVSGQEFWTPKVE